jgi:hypothetical protein
MRKPITRPWTEDEIERLKTMARSGASVARCSAAFNRPGTSIMSQARKVGVPIAGQRKVKAAQKAKIAAAEAKLPRGTWRNDGSRV